jgi:quercetin dioxygenase-like cupin family protein
MPRKLIWSFVLCTVIAAAYAGRALATPGSGITSSTVSLGRFDEFSVVTAGTVTHRASVTTKGASDVFVVTNRIAPGGHTGWHSHPGPSLITVQSGTATAYDGDDPSCAARVYSAGSGFIDPGDGHVHLLRNEGDVELVLVAVQILPAGAERRIDAPDPGTCTF